MTCENVGSTKARIYGVKGYPGFLNNHYFFSVLLVTDKGEYEVACEITPKSEENKVKQIMENHNKIVEKFLNNGIVDSDEVLALFVNKSIRAIGIIGDDCWFDVEDEFNPKEFKEFNIPIDSSKVY